MGYIYLSNIVTGLARLVISRRSDHIAQKYPHIVQYWTILVYIVDIGLNFGPLNITLLVKVNFFGLSPNGCDHGVDIWVGSCN